jgi:hypothetical protein
VVGIVSFQSYYRPEYKITKQQKTEIRMKIEWILGDLYWPVQSFDDINPSRCKEAFG